MACVGLRDEVVLLAAVGAVCFLGCGDSNGPASESSRPRNLQTGDPLITNTELEGVTIEGLPTISRDFYGIQLGMKPEEIPEATGTLGESGEYSAMTGMTSYEWTGAEGSEIEEADLYFHGDRLALIQFDMRDVSQEARSKLRESMKEAFGTPDEEIADGEVYRPTIDGQMIRVKLTWSDAMPASNIPENTLRLEVAYSTLEAIAFRAASEAMGN